LFSLERVDVFGNETLSTRQVEEIAGIWRGSQLLKLEIAALEEKLLADPRIVSARITRVFPNRLRVHIEENIGTAVLVYYDSFVEFDRAGTVVSIVSNFSQVNLPIVTGVDLTRAQLGHKISGTQFEAARELLRHIPLNVRPLISEINVSNPKDIHICTTSGIYIRIGSVEGVASRLALLPAVLYAYEVREFSRESISKVDMSSPIPVFKGR
jgi:cell division protein FtsQ